jgi:RimJ/RimL family protein N-acetyltransferase
MTKEILLRDVTEDDLPVFYENQLDPDAGWMAALQAREKEAFNSHWMKILGDETIIKKSIIFDGRVAGNIVSFQQAGKREVGYWIGREYWGKGIATKALSEFLSHDTTRPLYAYVARHNTASLRVLEKCGFIIMGEEKEFAQVGEEAVEGFILKLT